MATKLNVSSEFLSHYTPGSAITPSGSFSALQTTGGYGLLFSIGTDNACYLTQESPGADVADPTIWQPAELKAGWRQPQLMPSGVTVATQIAVAQRIPVDSNGQNGTADPSSQPNIHMALVESRPGQDDLLHLSLNCSPDDTKVGATDWANWMAHEFDGGERPFGGAANVQKAFISEAADNEYITIDLVNHTDSTICRYIIDPYAYADPNDPNAPQSLFGTGKMWNQQPLGVDVDASTASSVHGRRNQPDIYQGVDGIYTMGSTAQVIYKPLYNPVVDGNPFDPGNVPANTYLNLPNQAAVPTAITAARRPSDGYTDLYVASTVPNQPDIIYLFTAEKQDGSNPPVPLISAADYPIVAGVKQLLSYYNKTGDLVLWGLSAGPANPQPSNQQPAGSAGSPGPQPPANPIFYATCPNGQDPSVPASWRVSPPLLTTGAESIAALGNNANAANNFFVYSDAGTVQRAMQSPVTTTWAANDIRVPQDPNNPLPATRAHSFTTRIQVSNENGPCANTTVQINALHRVPVKINGIYRVLDVGWTSVNTDYTGAITIIEPVTIPRGTPLNVKHPDGTSAFANPMTNMVNRATTPPVTKDNPTGDLTKVPVPNKDGSPSNKTLIPGGTSSGDVDAATAALKQLGSIYGNLPTDGTVQAPKTGTLARVGGKITVGRVHALAVGDVSLFRPDFDFGGVVDSIGGAFGAVDGFVAGLPGDVFSALESATSYAIGLMEDTESDIWHFVANIAGTTYHFALDCAEKVAGAMVAIYSAIKAFIEDLIAWLEFLLEWGDFKRSMEVCREVVLMSLNFIIDHVQDLQSAFDNGLTDLTNEVNAWAGKSDWSGVNNSGQVPDFASTLYDASAGFISPAMFFYNHFVEGMLNLLDDEADASIDLGPLENAVKNQAGAMVTAVENLQAVVTSFPTQSLEDSLKQTTAIVVDALLGGIQDVIDALFDVLVELAQAGINSLTTGISIPIISDILHDVFGESFEFTWLEFVLMCGAIPGTLIYKAANGMPFGDKLSDAILNSNDTLDGFLQNWQQPSQTAAGSAFAEVRALDSGNGQGNSGNFWDDEIDKLNAAKLQGQQAKELFTVCHGVAGVAQWIRTYTIAPAADNSAPPMLRKLDFALGWASMLTLAASAMLSPVDPSENMAIAVLKKMATLQSCTVTAIAYVADADPSLKATADAITAVYQLFFSLYHLGELAAQGKTGVDVAAACLDEVTTIANQIGRLGKDYFQGKNDPKGLVVAVAACNLASDLEFANAALMASTI